MVHHHEPTYVFRLTHELALRWATLSIVLFFISVAGVSGFYQAIHGQTWTLVSASNQTNQWSALVVFLGFIAVLFGQIIIHELIHGVAFAAFGGSPRYGVSVKFFLPYAYATSPGTRFSRNAYLVIDLAPLVVIDLLCLVLVAIFPQAAWLGLVVVFNTSGASGDLWMATLLLRCPLRQLRWKIVIQVWRFTLLLMLIFVRYPLKLLVQKLVPLYGFGVTLRS
ncbi:MAG: hypothetical protein KatS3mg066_3780 [Fischerella sp.]|nr:MAG: hypothetical protein KatS3mg066_3780 [Fischerella sp.]